MKYISCFLLLASLSTASLAQSLIKSCAFDHMDEDMGNSSNVFEVRQTRSGYTGTMKTVINGRTSTIQDKVAVYEHKIRSGLSLDIFEDERKVSTLNKGEVLIVQTMALTDVDSWNDMMGDLGEEAGTNPFSTNVDLKLIRSVKVFEAIGNEGDIGSVAIVEAKDAEGKMLGSFLTGFFAYPCK